MAGPQDQSDRHSRRPGVRRRHGGRAAGRGGRTRRRERGDGRRGADEPRLGSCRGARPPARRLREHARPRAGRLLPRARGSSLAAFRPLRRDSVADRRRARGVGRSRPAAHVRVHGSERRQGGRAAADSGGDGRPGAGVPGEAARRRRRDERGLDGALSRGRGAAGRRRCGGAEGRGDARRALSGRLRRRVEESRHDGAARPARRGRPFAVEERHDDRVRRREAGGVRVQDDRRPVRGADQLLSRIGRADHGRHHARRPADPCKRAARTDPAPERQGERACRVAVRRRSRRRREAEGRRHRRRARRPRGAGRAAAHRLPRAGDELRDHAEGEGRRGEDGGRPPALGGGGSDHSDAP